MPRRRRRGLSRRKRSRRLSELTHEIGFILLLCFLALCLDSKQVQHLIELFGTRTSLPLDEEGNYAKRELPDGRFLYVNPLTYGRARLSISSRFSRFVFDDGF